MKATYTSNKSGLTATIDGPYVKLIGTDGSTIISTKLSYSQLHIIEERAYRPMTRGQAHGNPAREVFPELMRIARVKIDRQQGRGNEQYDS